MKAHLVLSLFLLGLTGKVPIVMAQSAGAFTPTGNMTIPWAQPGILLRDGTVLFAAFGYVQVYDPTTATFTATGDIITARGVETATLLADERVLIIGSDGSAQLYDPLTRTFADTGHMITAQIGFKATLLANGKVLIAGGGTGWSDCGPIIANAELYDPSTGAFTLTGSYANKFDCQFDSTSTLLPDGTVLFAVEPTAELYDPVSGTFSLTGAMTTHGQFGPYIAKPNYIAGRRATLLMSGKVLLTGGEHEDIGRFADAELYDPSTGTFTATSYMTRARDGHTATLLPDGTVLITGGESEVCSGAGCRVSGGEASAEIYDPRTGTFATAGNMTSRREWHAATLLNDGRVLIVGGLDWAGLGAPFLPLATAEVYTPPWLVAPPVMLSLSGDGKGQGAIQHAGTSRIASPSDPAVAGEYLSIYLTGLVDGSLIPPQLAIGGRLAEITFFGNVAGYPGLNVVNVRMPSGVAPGPDVPVRLTYLSRPSNEVTIGVQ